MLDTSARLLRLLSLLPTRAAWTGPELAERLDVTGRTLRRDIARLRELGYPVQATPGVAGGYRMGAGSALPPLLLEDDEAVAVVLSLRTAAGSTGTAETAAAALAKLERILPARLRRRAAALRQATVPLPGGAPEVGAEVLTVLAEACQERQVLAIGYRDRDGALTQRRVEPHRLVHAGRRWYLVARDRERDAWRTFRADRVEDPRRAGIVFTPADPPDAAAFVADAVTTAPYPVRARVLVHAPAAVVAAQVPPSAGVVEAVSADTCLLLTGAHTPGHIALHLALLGHPFTVLEPADLISELAVLAGRLTAAHRASVRAEG